MDHAEINSPNAKREEFVVVMEYHFNLPSVHQNFLGMFHNDTDGIGTIPPPQISPIVSPIPSQSPEVPQWILNLFGIISLFFILFVIICQR
jgi:hypothetical protein